MRKQYSKSRRDYARAYREIRLYGEEIFAANNWRKPNDAQDCASLSVDDKDAVFTGWQNRPRKFKFYDLMATRYPHLWWPF